MKTRTAAQISWSQSIQQNKSAWRHYSDVFFNPSEVKLCDSGHINISWIIAKSSYFFLTLAGNQVINFLFYVYLCFGEPLELCSFLQSSKPSASSSWGSFRLYWFTIFPIWWLACINMTAPNVNVSLWVKIQQRALWALKLDLNHLNLCV